MKYLILLLFTGILFYSCSSNKGGDISVVSAFPKTFELTADTRKIPVAFLLPRAMLISNDNLFVYKDNEEFLFDIFRLPDCDYLCSAGTRGQGPDDFLFLDFRSFQPTNNGFKVLDLESNRFKTVVFENNYLSTMSSEQIFQDKGAHNGLYSLTDNVFLTFGQMMEPNEYTLINTKTETFTKTGNYPQWLPESSSMSGVEQSLFTYVKDCVVHPDGKKFASFYSRFKRIRIYEYEPNESITLLHDVDVQVSPYSDNPEKERYQYYVGQPQAIGDYIYAICSNVNMDNDPQDAQVANDCEIQVWDWDGNPVANFRIGRYISSMVLSEKYNKIYALNKFVEDELYIYEIPSIK